jgi:AraC-like DNA-binding protein
MIYDNLEYKVVPPIAALHDYVESCWMLVNRSQLAHNIVVLPDGRIDVLFGYSAGEPFNSVLLGLTDTPEQTVLAPGTVMYAVSFKLPAAEYLLHMSMAGLFNKGQSLPDGFWGIEQADLDDFDHFCRKVTAAMQQCLKEPIDSRKQQLFELVYTSRGAMTVKELSERSFWSSRQINRYFTQQFGVSLKAYCNILRFRASFDHIKEGKLYPQQNFTDQAHFIKEVKKFAGVAPGELSRNKNGRFIQFLPLPKK